MAGLLITKLRKVIAKSVSEIGDYLAKLQARMQLSRALWENHSWHAQAAGILVFSDSACAILLSQDNSGRVRNDIPTQDETSECAKKHARRNQIYQLCQL